MESRPSRWSSTPYGVAAARVLAAKLGVSPVVGTILARRGFTDVEEARRFLAADERHPALSVPGMPEACELIADHLRRGSRIAVFGDYDVDGCCSTAIVVRALRALGAEPVWELPSRFDEGYGLSLAAVERLAGRGARLLLTVDCGITAVEQVAAARAAGMDVVVTDHHRPGPVLPSCTIVHPAPGGVTPYPAELCAAGVALKLSEALRQAAGDDPGEAGEDLDLAALATVCDLVPLRGENRRLVREGLVALARTRKPGVRALMEVAGVAPEDVSEHSLGFRLGPRLNAAGRMRRADAALELLLTEDATRAAEVARELDLLNRDRQEAETRILFAAEAACAPQASQAALVVAGEGWNAGVAGIVASRLVERWRRPAVVVALDADGRGRGSGRSIPGYDLHAGLAACADHLVRFGGHRMAAGLEVAGDRLQAFGAALAAHAGAALSPQDLIQVERVDAVVPGGALGLDLAEEIDRLRPFGAGNPQPTLLVPAARLENAAAMGQERQHSRFTLVTGASRARGVAFGSTPRAVAAAGAGTGHAAVRLEANRWNGTVEPRVLLRAFCPPAPGPLRVLDHEQAFWDRVRLCLAGAVTAGPPAGELFDRRGEGFAGVAGDLLSSGEEVLVAVADVARRRRSLAELVAGMAGHGLQVASWGLLEADPRLAGATAHLVALDPPPGGRRDPLLRAAPAAHMAWGSAEVDFALAAYRAELALRPVLADAFRALRALPPDASAAELERALCGKGHHPRSAGCCARVLSVLAELGLVSFDAAEPSCRVVEGARADLDRSPAYRAAGERLARAERALLAELPDAARASMGDAAALPAAVPA